MRLNVISNAIRPKIDALLAPIIDAYQIKDDGSVTTSVWKVRFYEAALIQLLDLSDTKLQPSDFEGCAWRALQATIKLRGRESLDFERELSREISIFKRKKLQPFRICARCYSSLPQEQIINIKLWSSEITISQNSPKISAKQPIISSSRRAFDEPEFGSWLTLTVYERTKTGALDRASGDIALLFGVLNFSMNLGVLTSHYGQKDIRAKLFPGMEIFLLDPEGTADTESWRYYTATPRNVNQISKSDIERISNNNAIILDSLNNKSKSDRLFYEDFFRLYFDALTEINHESEILRLWKAAEHVTMATSTVQIANRLAVTWKDKETVSAVCYAMGQRRNWITHSPKPSLNVEHLPEIFRNFLEHSIFGSLSKDVKSVAHWKAIMQLSDIGIKPDVAADALRVLQKLR